MITKGMQSTQAKIHWDDVHARNRKFNGFDQYAQSKLANMLHAKSLARKYNPENIAVFPVHPGTITKGSRFDRANRKSNAFFAYPATVGELVDDGHARRDFQAEDLLFRKPVKVHDDAAKRVAVGGDEDVLAAVDGGNQRGLKVGNRCGRPSVRGIHRWVVARRRSAARCGLARPRTSHGSRPC